MVEVFDDTQCLLRRLHVDYWKSQIIPDTKKPTPLSSAGFFLLSLLPQRERQGSGLISS